LAIDDKGQLFGFGNNSHGQAGVKEKSTTGQVFFKKKKSPRSRRKLPSSLQRG
jgi:alpha-tubulin suppressor-like RCC1 family protein